MRVATMKALDKIGGTNDNDPEIASILRLTASMFQAPVALVALFDQKRVYVSSSEGGCVARARAAAPALHAGARSARART